jgi:hypothetical protein
LKVLPEGTREGSWLRAVFEEDIEKKSEVMVEIDSLMDGLK